MMDCLRKTGLSNIEYVKYQFYCAKLNSTYKNVFIHTSLLEGLIVDESERKKPHIISKCSCCGYEKNFRNFRGALNILKDEPCQNNELLHKIYNNRNNLAHDFISLQQIEIDSNIKNLWENILNVYELDFINKLFEERYGFKPKDAIAKATPSELQQDS